MAARKNPMTGHLATLTMLEDDLKKGRTRCHLGQNGDGQVAKLEVSLDPDFGITAKVFCGKDDIHPTIITGLTAEQADALGWAFAKLC